MVETVEYIRKVITTRTAICLCFTTDSCRDSDIVTSPVELRTLE